MEKYSYPNLLILCRLCLQENSATIDIFKTPNLSLRIMTSTSLEVQSGDGLPYLICQDCRVQLERSYMFRKRCHLSDAKLRKHIRLINSGKKSKVFQPTEDEQEEESLEFEESLKYILHFENEEKKLSEEQRKIRELEIYENAKLEQSNSLLEEFKNFLSLKNQRKTCKSNIKLSSTHSQIDVLEKNYEDLLSPQRYCEKPEVSKKNILMFDENTEENELIFVVENPEDEDDNINVNEYDIQEENYESDCEEDCKNYENNDADKEMNQMLENIQNIEECNKDHLTDNSNLNNHTEENYTKIDKMENISFNLQNQKILKNLSPTKITHAKVSTKDGNIIEMEVYNSANNDNENVHMNIQSKSNDVNIFKCSLCPQSFTRRLLLQRHSSVHLKNKEYCCVYCKKWFACKSSLDRHTRIHTGEKPFECEKCGKKFIQREILKRHMHLHTGQKPFRCTHCNQSFVQKQVLQNHINLKHTENPVLKLHECFLCPKTFMHASGLSRHLLLHSGISYECHDCGKKFNDKSTLKRHTIGVHCSKVKKEITENNE